MKLPRLGVAMVTCGILFGLVVHAQPRPPVIVVRAGRGTGATVRQTTVIVENRGTAPISLRSNVVLQQRVAGRWQNASAAGLLLRSSCLGTQPATCVTVAGSTTLVTAPWTGRFGDSQCFCTRCMEAPAGTYRFVVSTCDGHPIEGSSFVLPAR